MACGPLDPCHAIRERPAIDLKRLSLGLLAFQQPSSQQD